jgi:hypothetical protein
VWESNPPLRLERAVSLADRRTSHRVGRGALESPSAGLQPAAGPSQLPAHSAIPTKRPGVFVTPGLRLRTSDLRGRASRPQGIEREQARRMIGGLLRFLATQDVTQPPGEHERPRCNGCLRPTRRMAELTARPVVFHPYRRGSPGGCSRDSEEILGAPLKRYSSWRRAIGDRSSTSLRYTNGSRPASLIGLHRASGR